MFTFIFGGDPHKALLIIEILCKQIIILQVWSEILVFDMNCECLLNSYRSLMF